MPDKMHGINDPEIRQRQRYADLIAGSLKLERDENDLTTRQVFEARAKLISSIRSFLDDHGYIEVETPMLTPKATGALAKPFKTHHNALDIDLYARIAPELYLKRLVVGGFEKVYELNRNFRNEGISTKHNPEFTMLEFYAAYMDVNGMMDLCEELLRSVVYVALGHTHVRYGDYPPIDFSQPFARIPMKDAIAKHWPERLKELRTEQVGTELFDRSWLDDRVRSMALARLADWYQAHQEIRVITEMSLSETGEATSRTFVMPEDFAPDPSKRYSEVPTMSSPPSELIHLTWQSALTDAQAKSFSNDGEAASA